MISRNSVKILSGLLLFCFVNSTSLAAQKPSTNQFWKTSALKELSGFAWDQRTRHLYGIADSGNRPYLFKMNPKTETLRKIQVLGVKNIDWEALVLDERQKVLWIVDGGNNSGKRKGILLHGILLRDLDRVVGLATPSVRPIKTIYAKWPGKLRDTEGVFLFKDSMVVVTKEPSAKPRLLTLDSSLTSPVEQTMTKWGKLPEMPSITDATVDSEGRIFLLTDKGIFELQNLEDKTGRTVRKLPIHLDGPFEAIACPQPNLFVVGSERGEIFLF